MDQFPFMKECLKQFNYPKIHGMDESEVADVFSKVNRQFLIGWILKRIDDDYGDAVDKANKEDLADLVYCMGFCNASEKEKFVNGDCESSKQFTILYKMFKHLKCTSDSKQSSETNKPVPIKEIVNCLAFDMNLFPMYGAKQTLTSEDRAKKISDYRKEIQELKRVLNTEHEAESEHVVDPTLNDRLASAMGNLESNNPDFRRKFLDVMKNRHVVDEKNMFSEDFAETLRASSENTQTVLEFMKSMNVVMNFKENNSRVKNVEGGDKNIVMMRELAELCNEVAALKKEHNI